MILMKIDINENELDYTIQGMERESSLKKQTKVVQREDNAILSVQSWILRALTIWVGQFNFNLILTYLKIHLSSHKPYINF